MADSPTHGATLTIDLGALAANYRLLSARAAPAECAAVVKADAYGLGIETAVPALARAGCRTFFVAHLSEATRVRALLPDAVVYVLNGLLPGMAPALAAIGVRPVLSSLPEVEEWRAFAGLHKAPPAALQVDTGMNRLGLSLAEAARLNPDGLDLSLVMTHFVSAEEPENPLNARQRRDLESALTTFMKTPSSLANSSGVFMPADAKFHMARTGYALYGGNPTPGRKNPMQPVVRLTAPVVTLRKVPQGGTVGYNAKWTAKRDSTIATISVGYADGYPRAASATDRKPGGEARIGDLIVPFAGRVSMDLITIDVTDAPAGNVMRGTEISLIDEVLDIDRVGANAGTIGYEVLTSLGRRYRRVVVGG